MIFSNPAGAPELACDACGCRWFDRQTNSCYECGHPVPQSDIDEFAAALRRFWEQQGRARGNTDVGRDGFVDPDAG